MASRVPKLTENPRKTNGLHFLNKAKKACVDNKYTEAYEYFVHYFESLNHPSEATSAVQMVFTKLVCKIGTVLEATDNVEELLKCYIQAINFFPENYVILNNLGAYMFKIGEIDIARRYIEHSISASKNYLSAEKNLMHVKWHQINRWHFPMLNDKARNIAYAKAISSVMSQGYKNVVDIGAGCGLLSLLASKDPEAEVVAYEENKALFKMCTEVIKENNATNIKIVNCHSTDIEDPSHKCNLLVTEIFDVALFGERALETIWHALSVFRTEEDLKIIPSGAKVHVTGIYSEELASKHRIIYKDYLRLLNLSKQTCIRQHEGEPYEAENLSDHNVKYITETTEIFDIRFDDIDHISQLLNDDSFHRTVNLKCHEGTINALAVWFDLNLTDEISLTTDPHKDDCVKCWEQAVFYLDHPVEVKDGEILGVDVTANDCKLSFPLIDRDEVPHECFRVSKEIISFLNDEDWVRAIAAVAWKFIEKKIYVVDYNVFPLLGLLLAKNKKCCVYHYPPNPKDLPFLQHILAINNIPKENFVFLKECLSITSEKQLSKPTLVFFDTIKTDGSLEMNFLKERNQLSSAMVVPHKIQVSVQLIYSEFIYHSNKVHDENVFNFSIAKFMNEYSGNEHPDLDKLDYVEYSKVISFTVDEDGDKMGHITATKSGQINALYYWYDLLLYEDIEFSTLSSTHFKKSCFFLNEPKSVNVGDKLEIVLQTECPYIKIYLR